jgi:hypothetical protein
VKADEKSTISVRSNPVRITLSGDALDTTNQARHFSHQI